MGMLLNRLLIILIEEDLHSTHYHIAMTLLKHFDEIQWLSIGEIAELCHVSKSTISKFSRDIGFSDYLEFKDAAKFMDNRYHNQYSYNVNVMNYIEHHDFASYTQHIMNDIQDLTKQIDHMNIDRLAKDLVYYEKVATFGLLFSQSAAIDLQTKLAYNKKFIFTSMSDVKQQEYIENAKEDTLIIIFSHSGNYLLKQQLMEGNLHKNIFHKTKAKIVVITSHPHLEDISRADYCIHYPNTINVSTHASLYPIISDYIAYRYRYFKEQSEK